MTSSMGAQMTPESAPPMKPAATFSPSDIARSDPPVIALDTAPVSGNWAPVSTDMLMMDMPMPL
eukprot:6849969-Prymnesium_polylepis.1